VRTKPGTEQRISKGFSEVESKSTH